jgi:hypothetical protein
VEDGRAVDRTGQFGGLLYRYGFESSLMLSHELAILTFPALTDDTSYYRFMSSRLGSTLLRLRYLRIGTVQYSSR